MAGLLAAAVGVGPAPPQQRCVVDDPRLDELSGLVVAGDSAWAMADGGNRVAIHRLDLSGPECAITTTRTAPMNPFDPEDLALGPGGSLWVADIGDNERTRDSVAVVVLPPTGPPQLHRLTYPDGPHDAEALLVDRAGRPVVIVKDLGSAAGVYRPAAAPSGAGPTPMERVGGVALPSTETKGGPVGGIGSRLVTGAAATADGTVVALRTYTDAWLFPAPDGDPVTALAGEPVQVPLPGEPQGEAIAFELDGTLLSGSETRGGVRGEVRAVSGATGLIPAVRKPAPAALPPPPAAGTPEWLPAAIGGAAVVVLLGVLALVMSLRGRRS